MKKFVLYQGAICASPLEVGEPAKIYLPSGEVVYTDPIRAIGADTMTRSTFDTENERFIVLGSYARVAAVAA